jgi:hypothetical protein
MAVSPTEQEIELSPHIAFRDATLLAADAAREIPVTTASVFVEYVLDRQRTRLGGRGNRRFLDNCHRPTNGTIANGRA